MIRNASSLPLRNSATSCSSDRRRSSGEPIESRLRASAAGAWRAEASTLEGSLARDSNGSRGRKFRPSQAAEMGASGRALADSFEAHHDVLDLRVVLEGV